MAVKTVYECDVCGLTAEDVSTWRQVSINSMAPPAEQVPGMAPALPVASVPVMLCQKQTCLTKWAAAQNKGKGT